MKATLFLFYIAMIVFIVFDGKYVSEGLHFGGKALPIKKTWLIAGMLSSIVLVSSMFLFYITLWLFI